MPRLKLLNRFIRQGHTEVVTASEDNILLRTVIYLDGDRNNYLPRGDISPALYQQHQIAVQQHQTNLLTQIQFLSRSVIAIVVCIVTPGLLSLYNLADDLWQYALATAFSALLGMGLRKLLLYLAHQLISRLDLSNE